MLNTPKNARRKRGYLLNRLNTRKFAVAVDIAGKYHLDSTLLDGHRRGPSPQQIIAQRLSAAIRQARRVDPTSLAYRGAKTLGDYLLWGRTPTVPVQKGAVEMVFASNVDRYCELAGI